MNNLQVLLAQIGGRAARAHPRAMLVERVELPGTGWEVKGERSWRTGAWGTSPSEAGRRARQHRSFSANRLFEQSGAPRWVSVQVVPCGSVSDAEAAVPDLQSRFMPNPKTRVAVAREGVVAAVEVPEVPHPWVYEQLTTGMPEGPTATRYIGGNVENVVFIVACTGYEEAWPWTEVSVIASLQAAKVRAILDH